MNKDSLNGTDYIGSVPSKEAVEMVSSKEGTFTIYGLDQGTYYLKETEAPEGYRVLLDPIVLQVTPEFSEERNNYIKSQGATEEVLKSLHAEVLFQSFFEGLLQEETMDLKTNPDEGAMNLTVVNQVGMKLPVTGTSSLIVILCAGTGMMICATAFRKRKK